jgi:hypothetical protein
MEFVMITKAPHISEATLAVCDHVSEIFYSRSTEASYVVGDRAMRIIGRPSGVANGPESVLQAILKRAYHESVHVEPSFAHHRNEFYSMIGIDPVYSPFDDPFTMTPAEAPANDPNQLPLFAA